MVILLLVNNLRWTSCRSFGGKVPGEGFEPETAVQQLSHAAPYWKSNVAEP
jgi:hypothetical protein